LCSAGYKPFFHQGIPFLLYIPNGSYENAILRCLWGSTKPIENLLERVRNESEVKQTHLDITYVFSTGQKTHNCRKRLLETVDLNPIVKQELLSDLQDFFNEDTEDYYYQNGTPYRRGYLFYDPAGTGKTSLSTAIASHYDLPLYVMELAGMSDSMLQDAVKKFPKYCVILFEDIEAAGIVRESTMLKRDGKKQRNDEPIADSDESSEPAVTKALFQSRPRPVIVEPQTQQPPQKTQVTLSGLLNTLDGPGSKEGHMVILTTNAPDSLDKAIYRPGGIELKLFLGYSTSVTAGITFIRIFGSDKRLVMSKGDLNRLGRRFGKMVPDNVLTPAEVQQFYTNRRELQR
jgi:chaperone BCS1